MRMTDKEKLTKAVKLADAMYYAAQYLTTDASRLHKAMEEYHQFIILEYFKEEPVSEDLEAEIVSLSKQFPEVSFAKLSRIAVRVAKWQKGRIADIVKQYADKGEKNYQDSYVNDGKCSTSTCYWDGYRDCANGIKRELED